jgi:hypothetical protein
LTLARKLSTPAETERASDSTAAPASVNAGLRLVAIEQLHPELLLEIGDRVADRRRSAPAPTARRRETARLDHRKENGELVEAGHPRSLHFKFPAFQIP